MSEVLETWSTFRTEYRLGEHTAAVYRDVFDENWHGTVDGKWYTSTSSRDIAERNTKAALIYKVAHLEENTSPVSPLMWAIREVSNDTAIAWVPEWIAARMMATSLMQTDRRWDLYVKDDAETVK